MSSEILKKGQNSLARYLQGGISVQMYTPGQGCSFGTIFASPFSQKKTENLRAFFKKGVDTANKLRLLVQIKNPPPSRGMGQQSWGGTVYRIWRESKSQFSCATSKETPAARCAAKCSILRSAILSGSSRQSPAERSKIALGSFSRIS